MLQKTCPSRGDWTNYIHGSPTIASDHEMETHLLQCTDCRRVLEAVQADDTVCALIDMTISTFETSMPIEVDSKKILTILDRILPSQSIVTMSSSSDVPHTLIGKFRVMGVLGRGGMGIVYRAEDSQLGREVALKIPNGEFSKSQQFRERFLREARLAAAVRHPGIATIFEVGEADETPYIAMELLQGETLAKYMEDHAPIGMTQALTIAKQIFLALAAAHEKGIIHRDIKPSNILLEFMDDPNPHVKLLDFGIAKSIGVDHNITRTGGILGTPEYMSPEQVRGLPLSPLSDLFSTGAILYQMVTARSPFRSNDTMSTLYQVSTLNQPPADQINPSVPRPVSEFIQSLLEKEPSQRPKSADFAVASLQRLQADITAPSAVRASHRSSRFSKPPMVRIAFGTIFAFALIALGIFWKIETSKGTFQIELEDESLAVKLQKDGLIIEDENGKKYTLRAKGSFRTQPGIYQPTSDSGLRMQLLTGDGIRADVDKFELLRGETLRIRVSLAEGAGTSGESRVPSSRTIVSTVRLDRNQIPIDERYLWQPRELMAVIGTHSRKARGSHADPPLIDPQNRFVVVTGDSAAEKAVWSLEENFRAFTIEPPIINTRNTLQVFSRDGTRMAIGNDIRRIKGDVQSISIEPLYSKPIDCGGNSAISGSGRWLIAVEPGMVVNQLQLWRLDDNEAVLFHRIFLESKLDVRQVWLQWLDNDRTLEMLFNNFEHSTTTHWPVDWTNPENPQFGAPETKEGEWLYSNDKSFSVVRTSPTAFSIHSLDSDVSPREFPALAPQPSYIAISPDSQWIAFTRGVTLELLHRVSGKWESIQIDSRIANLGKLSFSHDSKTLAVGGHVSGDLALYDLTRPVPQELWPPRSIAVLRNIEFSPDGKFLAVTGPIGTSLYNVAGELPTQVEETIFTQGSYGWSFDNNTTLASVGSNLLIDLSKVKPRRMRELTMDGQEGLLILGARRDQLFRLIRGDQSSLEEWQLEFDDKWPDGRATFKQRREVEPQIEVVERSLVGGFVLTQQYGSSTIKMWNLERFEEEPISLEGNPSGDGYDGGLDISRDGKLVSSCSFGSSKIYVFDVEKSPPSRRDITPVAYPTEAAFLGDQNQYLMAVGAEMVIYDIARGTPIWRRKMPGNTSDIAVHPDGIHVAVLNDNSTIYVYNFLDFLRERGAVPSK